MTSRPGFSGVLRHRWCFLLLSLIYVLASLGLFATQVMKPVDISFYASHSATLFGGDYAPPSPLKEYLGFRPPFFSLLIKILGTLSPAHVLGLVIAMNVALLLLAYYLLVRTMELISGRSRPILYPAILFANIWLLHEEALIVRETMVYVVLMALSVWLCTACTERRWFGAVLGIVAGLAMLTRPTGFVILGAFALFLLFRVVTGRATARRASGLGLQFAVAMILIVLPWQIYLRTQIGRFEISGSCTSGQNIFKGNHSVMRDIVGSIDVDNAEPAMDAYMERRYPDAYTPSAGVCARDALLRQDALADIAAHPLDVAKGLFAKAVLYFSPVPIPLGDGEVVAAPGKPFQINGFKHRGVNNYAYYVYASMLMTMAVVGAIYARSTFGARVDLVVFLAILYVGHAAVYIAAFPEWRYRLPMDAVIAVAAALGLGRLAAPVA